MRTLISAVFIVVFSLSIFVTFPIVNAKDTTTNESVPFQYEYRANGTLTNFDIQSEHSFKQGEFFISLAENNNIYYNNFSFYQPNTPGHQLTHQDFRVLTVSSNMLNSSTTLQASQFYFNSKMNVFLIYFSYNGGNYLYILVYDLLMNNILQKQLLSNINYFKTNKIIQFTGSDTVYLEIRTEDSFEFLSVNANNYAITKVFESKKVDLSTNSFDINDPQFIDGKFYIIFNEEYRNANLYNASIYAFNLNNSALYNTYYYFPTYISSLSVFNNTMFAYSEFNNRVHVIDISTHYEQYIIENAIVDNFTYIRAFNDKSFILRDFQDNFYYCYVQQQGNSYSMMYNNTIFGLYNSNPSLPQLFDSNSQNNEYTLALIGDYNYFIAGYTVNNGVKDGFGVVYQSMNTKPTIFIDTSKLGTNSVTVSSGVTTSIVSVNSSLLPIFAFIIVLVIIILLGIFFAYMKKKDEFIDKPAKKLQNNDYATFTKSTSSQTKLCNTCGSKVSETDMFCQNCGNRI